jgi:hypothetical protein
VFDAMQIPHKSVPRFSLLGDVQEGLVVIGEGVSLVDHRSLAETVVPLAARGVPVLWLAPSEGSFVLPGSETSAPPRPARVIFRELEAQAEWDKRLDAGTWAAEERVTRFALVARSGRVLVEANRQDGWPWLQLKYSAPKGRLMLCGAALMEPWEEGPSPRFLFARLLEELSQTPENESLAATHLKKE